MKETFPIIPASSGPIWLFIGLAVLMFALVALFGYFAYSSRNMRFEVSHEGLRITGGLYGRQIPLRSLVIDGAKPIDLRREDTYRLKWRTNGAGLPGYSAGWFRLQNGEKALVFITDSRRVLYLPTREGYSVLMSVADPEAVLRALRQAASQALTQVQ